MVPVGQRDDSRLVVDIVKARMRVIGIVDDESTTEAVTVLGRQMAVVPESTSLVGRREVVQERVVSRNGALADHGHTVSPVGALLEEAVPVLWGNRSGLKL